MSWPSQYYINTHLYLTAQLVGHEYRKNKYQGKHQEEPFIYSGLAELKYGYCL